LSPWATSSRSLPKTLRETRCGDASYRTRNTSKVVGFSRNAVVGQWVRFGLAGEHGSALL
jgi:hypothetical protein